jgi:hypothetical protein
MVPQLLMGMCQIKEYYMTTLINSEKKKKQLSNHERNGRTNVINVCN